MVLLKRMTKKENVVLSFLQSLFGYIKYEIIIFISDLILLSYIDYLVSKY